MSKKNKNTSIPKPQVSAKPISSKTETKQEVIALEPVSYNYIFAALMGLVGVLLYANTYKHGYVLDDQVAITLNQNVQKGLGGISGIFRQDFWEFLNQKSGYYRPLPLLTFAIEHEFFGNNSSVSHIGNIILYGLTGFFVFLVLQRWFRSTSSILLLLISLIFISHPTHTEVVSNIKSRDEILSTLFLLTTLLTFDIYFDTKKIKYLIISCLSMYLAYLSKESAIIGLGLIGLSVYTFKKQTIAKSLLVLIPFVVVTMIFFIQKSSMLGSLSGNMEKNLIVYPYFIEKTQFFSTFKLFTYYLKMSFVPYPLLHDYSFNQIPSGKIADLFTIIGILAFIGIIFLIFKNLKNRNWLFFGLAFFMISIFPALAFTLSRGGIFAERFLYLPSLGFAILLVLGLSSFSKKVEDKEYMTGILSKNLVPIIASVVAIGFFSFISFKRNPDWVNEFALNQADIKSGAENSMIQLHYANSYTEKFAVEKNEKLKKEYKEKATKSYQKALSIADVGEAYYGMGRIHQLENNLDSSRHYYRETMRKMPNYVLAYNNLGAVYDRMGRYVLASYYFNISTRVNPGYQPSQNNKAAYLKEKGLDIQVLPDSLKNEEVPVLMNQLNFRR